jgi:hypothetical protein
MAFWHGKEKRLQHDPEVTPTGSERMIQGRIWSQRMPIHEVRRDVAEQRYEWFYQLHPRLFDPRRYVGQEPPENIGKGCMVCMIDTRDTAIQQCPRCRRRLIWVSFEPLPY